MKREPIKIHRQDIHEAIKEFKDHDGEYPKGLKLVNIRGTNASGKSTTPMQMLENDKTTYVLTLEGKDVATVFPKYNFIALGTYFTKTGGLDRIRTTDQAKELLKLTNELPHNILFEGILCSTVFSTWAEQLKLYEATPPHRKAYVINILPPFEVIKERVLKRNGGNENIKWEQLLSKWNTVKKNVAKFADEGLISLEVDNSGITIEETLDWFFGLIGEGK